MTSVDKELETIDERLSALEQEKMSLLKLKLKQRLTARERLPAQVEISAQAPASAREKIALFGELFRGRQEVHAVRWENKQGRQGYVLACDNEWRQGICHKPKVKCGECLHQAFQPLDQRAFY